MNGKKICVCLAAVLCALLCGCSMRLFDVEPLMSPPQTTGDKEALHRLLEQDAGTLNFVYPSSGENRSAVTMVSFAGKEFPGAIAFYENSEGGTTLSFAMQEHGDWRIVSHFFNTSSQVDRVCFADLNGDGAQEVVVSWGSVQALTSILSVYSYNGTTVTEYSLSRPYGEFAVTDLDCDGNEELFVAEVYTELEISAENAHSENQSLALLYGLGKNGLEITMTVELDPTVRRYSQLVVTPLPDSPYGKCSGVMLDGLRADGTVVTQLVYIDPRRDRLTAPLSGATNVTSRPGVANVTSRDMDGDGVYELPVVRLLPTPENLQPQSVSYVVNWQKFIPGESATQTVCSTVYNSTDGYMLSLPEKWLGDNVTCRYDTESGTLTLYGVEKTESTVTLGAALLRIRRYSKMEWESLTETENYTAVYTMNNVIFAATLPSPDSPLTLSLQGVSERIIPILE